MRPFTAVAGAPLAALAALVLPGPAHAADPWSEVVAKSATRAQVVAELGAPEIEFTAFVEKGLMPLQFAPSLPAPPAPGETPGFADDDLLRVLEYKGSRRGLSFQVVLKDEKTWYCVAPPLPEESTAAAVARKYGAPAPERADVRVADLLRTWELLPYPKAKRVFVREPGEDTMRARVILP